MPQLPTTNLVKPTANCQTNLAGVPNTVFEENTAGCDFVDVRPRAALDRFLSGLELSFHLKAVKTIVQHLLAICAFENGPHIFYIYFQPDSRRISCIYTNV